MGGGADLGEVVMDKDTLPLDGAPESGPVRDEGREVDRTAPPVPPQRRWARWPHPGTGDASSAGASATVPLGGGVARSLLLGLLAAVVIVVPAGAAYLLSALRTPVYGAQVDFLVRPASASVPLSDSDLQTQKVLLTARAILQPAAAAQGMSVARLQEAVSADIVGGSQVLRLTVADARPAAARQLAAAIVSSYESWSASSLTAGGPGGVAGSGAIAGSGASEPQLLPLSSPYVPARPLRPKPIQSLAIAALVASFIAGGLVMLLYVRSRQPPPTPLTSQQEAGGGDGEVR
jgi:capsular polysaccharide biosynthesis protein